MRKVLKSPFLIALAAVLLCVLIDSTQAFNHVYWNVWYKNAEKYQVRNVAIISLDGGRHSDSGTFVGSTARQAELVERLTAMGARRIFLDRPGNLGVDPEGDARLFKALRRLGKQAAFVVRARIERDTAHSTYSKLESSLGSTLGGIPVVTSVWDVNFMGYALTARQGEKGQLTHITSELLQGDDGPAIQPDYTVDPSSIPMFNVAAVLDGTRASNCCGGRDVFVTITNPEARSALGYFGHSRNVPGAVIDIAAIHGRSNKQPVDLGEAPILVLVVALILAGRRVRRRRAKAPIYVAAVLVALLGPGIVREFGYICQPAAAIIMIAVYAPIRSSQKWRRQVQLTSAASGLPNIEALTAEGIARSQDVVAASISQYEQMLASLPKELHGECARQIARRLCLGAGDRQIFDNDNGHFAWLENSRTLDEIVEHLEGLRALFSSPLVINGHVLDTTIHFGLDRNIDSRPITRIQSALATASEAQAKGKLYEEFGHQRLAQSPWELSLHARIDEGLRNGDIWLALQPQLDLRENRIAGAEALIRWNDPERGVIPPDAFILQAERAGRIEAITYWVFERSIAMLGEFNRIAGSFQISVNLSARMVDHPGLVGRVSDIVRAHPIDCSKITFEVTETFSLANREQAKSNLADLRTMGFRVSIDDFGTGQASLAYLAEIPSDELKLDKRFVQAITTDARERCIVESVIRLAHALGQEVVAEGIEDEATLLELGKLDCDIAQGYHVGKPMKPANLLAMLQASQFRTGAG